MQRTDPKGPHLSCWEFELGKGRWKAINLSPLDRYSIRRTSDKGQFFQVNKKGDIYNEKELDRELYPWYNLTVEAKELDSNGEWAPSTRGLGFSPFPHSFKIGIICHCESRDITSSC